MQHAKQPKTNARPSLRSILVIDPDQRYLDSFRQDSLFSSFQPVLVSEGKRAEAAIASDDTRFLGIFISSTQAWPCAIPLIRKAHQHHPGTPVFVLYRGFPPFTENEISRLAVHEMVRKPASFSELLKKVFSGTELPVFKDGSEQEGAAGQQVASEKGAESSKDEDFLPVRVEEFLSDAPAFFDVYLKSPTGKYLKILNTKEKFGTERVLKYIENGASYLYIRRASQMRCLLYCDLLSKNILGSADTSPEMKFLHTAGLGTEFLNQFTQAAVDEEGEAPPLDYGVSYLGGLFNLVRQQKSGQGDLISTYVKNSDAIEHAISVSFVCALLSLPLKIEAPKLFRQLGLASMFHDIGLAKMPEKFADEDLSQMDEEERVLFHTHPLVSVEMLEKTGSFDTITLQAVAQHHERRDNSGFPRRPSVENIHLFSELIGISDEFVRLMQRKRKQPDLDVKAALEGQVFNGFSLKVVDAFRAVFLKDGVLQPLNQPS